MKKTQTSATRATGPGGVVQDSTFNGGTTRWAGRADRNRAHPETDMMKESTQAKPGGVVTTVTVEKHDPPQTRLAKRRLLEWRQQDFVVRDPARLPASGVGDLRDWGINE